MSGFEPLKTSFFDSGYFKLGVWHKYCRHESLAPGWTGAFVPYTSSTPNKPVTASGLPLEEAIHFLRCGIFLHSKGIPRWQHESLAANTSGSALLLKEESRKHIIVSTTVHQKCRSGTLAFVWNQDLARQMLYHLSHISSFSYFSNRVLYLCLGWPGPQFSYFCFLCSWDDKMSTTVSIFLCGWDRVSWTFCLDWPRTSYSPNIHLLSS
jgi:hypothetical protein